MGRWSLFFTILPLCLAAAPAGEAGIIDQGEGDQAYKNVTVLEAPDRFHEAECTTPFRQAIKKAMLVFKKHSDTFPTEFRNTNLDSLKKEIQPLQKRLATHQLELEEALETLMAGGETKDKETTKLWLARYTYILACLKLRSALLYEYQYALSEIRTDSLPERPEGSPGWRLASQEQMRCSGGEEAKRAKHYLRDARKILEDLASEHRGTPWEIFAKRKTPASPGLSWEPIP